VSVRLLTPPGAGGVAVLELSGLRAREELAHLWAGARTAPTGALRLARLALEGEPLDEALVWIASDVRIELHVHGSPPLVRTLLSRLCAATESAASTEETGGTARASIEERASKLLPHAVGEAAARILLDQAQGALRAELRRVVGLDSPARACEPLEQLVEAARIASRSLRTTSVALVGPVNAGKSTLFNALVGEQRAIVSAAPGVTRDLLVARTQLGDWPVELVDTAGERDLAGRAGPHVEIEAVGQQLAQRAQRDAEWIVRLWPSDGPAPSGARPSGAARHTWLASRADCGSPPLAGCDGAVSAGPDPHGAARTLERLFRAAFALPPSAWTAGRAAPFDARSVEGVTSAVEAARGGRRDWREPLAALLAD
jgi:tRNA modification GTPase